MNLTTWAQTSSLSCLETSLAAGNERLLVSVCARGDTDKYQGKALVRNKHMCVFIIQCVTLMTHDPHTATGTGSVWDVRGRTPRVLVEWPVVHTTTISSCRLGGGWEAHGVGLFDVRCAAT